MASSEAESQNQSAGYEELISAQYHNHNSISALEMEPLLPFGDSSGGPPNAICRIRIEQPASYASQIQGSLDNKLISAQSKQIDNGTLTLEKEDSSSVPLETRLQWAKSISETVFKRVGLHEACGVRDWDFILSLDGSVENSADNTAPSAKVYPPQYRIPNHIIQRLDSHQDKVCRAELFALGGLLYQVFSGKEVSSTLGSDGNEEHIQSCFVKGEFPEDVWKLPYAVRILGCWCPGFAKDLLAAHSKDESFQSKFTSYIKKHPVLFGFQVAGGILSLASIAALPILGAVGFGAAGPAAGSAAAAWQSSMGLVEAGSFFAWCQSAAMGGAAVGGIWAAGLAGAGVAVGAAVAGAFDGVDTPPSDLKEKFLIAWRRDGGEARE
ncbi:hypothetical protein EG329_000281 [Mollisiaceae sp. DMI_Dod_QoI]|nr:hypothetical protein EG329_000281 [Helotiales sp. DMI_Dod_QoI]